MKKSFLTAILAVFTFGVTSVYGQFNLPDANGNVLLTNTSNNLIVGPVPSAPTNLHVNSNTVVGTSSNTTLTY